MSKNLDMTTTPLLPSPPGPIPGPGAYPYIPAPQFIPASPLLPGALPAPSSTAVEALKYIEGTLASSPTIYVKKIIDQTAGMKVWYEVYPGTLLAPGPQLFKIDVSNVPPISCCKVCCAACCVCCNCSCKVTAIGNYDINLDISTPTNIPVGRMIITDANTLGSVLYLGDQFSGRSRLGWALHNGVQIGSFQVTGKTNGDLYASKPIEGCGASCCPDKNLIGTYYYAPGDAKAFTIKRIPKGCECKCSPGRIEFDIEIEKAGASYLESQLLIVSTAITLSYYLYA